MQGPFRHNLNYNAEGCLQAQHVCVLKRKNPQPIFLDVVQSDNRLPYESLHGIAPIAKSPALSMGTSAPPWLCSPPHPSGASGGNYTNLYSFQHVRRLPRRPVHSVCMLSMRLLNALESPRAYERDFVSSGQTQDRPLSFHQWQKKQIIDILCINLWQKSHSAQLHQEAKKYYNYNLLI